MNELTSEERQYVMRIGDGSFDLGVRRLIRYAKALRHDLRGVQHGLTIQAAILSRDGNPEAGDLLKMSVQQIEDLIQAAAEAEE